MSPASPQPDQPRSSITPREEPRFLIIGEVTKPHGVRGELRVLPHTDQPERFTWLEEVFIGKDDPQPVVVESARMHKKMVLLKLQGYDNREDVQRLRGAWLQVPLAAALPLAEDEYYLYQLEGLQAVTDEGEPLGVLAEVIETGANNVFLVRGNRGELLLPDIPEVILGIDFENGRISVHLLPGLID